MEPKEYWSEKYKRPVSEEEIRQIQTNLSGFFGTLKEWDDADKRLNKDEQAK